MSRPTTLQLTHFRNHHDLTVTLGRQTVLVGPNGIGKTNILEAIRTISVTRSYRVEHDRDTIEWGETFCRLVWTGRPKIEYALTLEPVKKTVKRDGTASPLAAVYGAVPTVLFSPEILALISGAPVERRRFLDTLLSQADRLYLDRLLTYRQVLRERHFVLLRLAQGLGVADELDFWDGQLAADGCYLIEKRREFIRDISGELKETYGRLTGQSGDARVVYEPAAEPDALAERLKISRSWDIKSASTRFGPHRDELRFFLSDRDASVFASRGEARGLILATKLAEAAWLTRSLSYRDSLPADGVWLLLDDVFSEFDATHQRALLGLIAPYTTVITTIESGHIPAATGTVIHRLPLPSPTRRPRRAKAIRR